jgi:putative ABC transport system permease protein
MRIVVKLVLAYVARHPARMALTALAIVAAACVVVWVVSSYDAMVSQFGGQASEYLGRYDMFVVPDSPKTPTIAPELVAALRCEPSFAEVEPVSQTRVQVLNRNAKGGPGGRAGEFGGGPDGAPPGPRGPGGRKGRPGGPEGPADPSSAESAGQGETLRGPRGSTLPVRRGGAAPMRPMGPTLVGTDAGESPYPMLQGVWIDPTRPGRREGVLSNVSAEQLDVSVGDEVLLIVGPKEFHLKIVGICSQASAPGGGRGGGFAAGPAAAALYVPSKEAIHFTRGAAQINLVSIKFKPGVDLAEVRTAWLPRVAAAEPAALMLGVENIKAGMEEGMSAASARKQAWAATGISLLAALFIIFTTLSMGVNERVRQFAVMRAVGLTRLHVACVIALEGLLLALIGWGGGLVAGWGLLEVVSRARPGLFAQGASLGLWCVLLSGASAFGGALAASILPAWRAMSVQPLEAMSPRRAPRPGMRWLVLAGTTGLILIAVNPILVYVVPAPDAMRYAIYQAVGCSSMAVGFLLLAPIAIVAAEGLFTPWIGRLVGLERHLLASHLSSNLWRTLGTTVALSVGLGLYVAMQVWGYSMLQPFLPGDWTPDMLVSLQSGGLPDAEFGALSRCRGILPGQCMPLAVEQPRLAGDITGSEERASVTRQDNVVVIGVDPDVAFGGPKPLLKVSFVRGNRAEVLSQFGQGRYCVVPDYFVRTTGLGIGDHFEMVPPEKPQQTVQYTIAGVVSLPGSHYMTKFSGLRRRSGRMAAIVFAPFEEVRRDFGLTRTNFFWMNIDKDVDVDEIGAGMQAIADRNLGEAQPVNAQGTWTHRARVFGTSLRITLADDIRANLFMRADDAIWAMSQLPLITLLVTSLGVVNTVMASVRARRWEMGVLRAVGVTRLGLFRMILAEGLLIGLIACLVSFGFGVMAGWCGTGISQYVSFFGGLAPPLVIPWAPLSLGFGATLGLCLIAALWPAIAAGRSEPLSLLQAGRAAM